MEKHPIEGIMASTMESIRDMVDVDTIIGQPIETRDGSTIIPLSRVSFGFIAGGGEYECGNAKKAVSETAKSGDTPFAGGSGAGVSVTPMGFVVVDNGQIRLLPVQPYAPLDRVIEMAPQVLGEIKSYLKGQCGKKKDEAKPEDDM